MAGKNKVMEYKNAKVRKWDAEVRQENLNAYGCSRLWHEESRKSLLKDHERMVVEMFMSARAKADALMRGEAS